MTFFFAGMDTTSSFFQYMVYLMALHPEVEKKIREEIDRLIKHDDYTF